MAGSNAILNITDVSKHFAGIAALEHVSLGFYPGEIHALLGENGAGKSTLVKIAAGVQRADTGKVTFKGRPFVPRDPDHAARQGLGVVFQELPLVPDMTVMENVYFNRQPTSVVGMVSLRRMERDCAALFDRLGLGTLDPTSYVRDLSVTARQFVAIAKVLSYDPDVVVFDEATSALGPGEVQWLLNHAVELAARGKAVIFISHRLAEVDAIAHQITVLRNGTKVATWSRGEISDDELISAMLGRRLEQLFPEAISAPRSKTVLETRALSAGRRLITADIKVHEGEIVGMAALEGQGQRELFLALYGAIKSRGEILIDGVPQKIHSPRDALGAGIGMALVPEDRQADGLLPSLTVRENLSLAIIGRLTRKGLIRRSVETSSVTPVVNELNIGGGNTEGVVAGLSGGNQQKVVVGKFLLYGARVLLLYDLTRGVDVGAKAEIFKLIRRLAAEGYAILFYSSDLVELANLPNRVLVMYDGRVTAEFDVGDVDEEGLVAAMVGQAQKRISASREALTAAAATAHDGRTAGEYL